MFYVSSHLLQALQALSAYLIAREKQRFAVWIDAVCIDQSNLDEKAFRVPSIGKVFGNATQVVVWFGQPTEKTLPAIYILQWLDLKFGKDQDHTGRENLLTPKVELERKLLSLGKTRANLNALLDFVSLVEGLDTYDGKLANDHFIRIEKSKAMIAPTDPIWEQLFTFLNNAWHRRICMHPIISRVYTTFRLTRSGTYRNYTLQKKLRYYPATSP